MKLKKFYILFLTVMAGLSGCQQEVTEVKLPKPEEAFTASSNAAKLFKEIAMQDGSPDNILDSSSCVSLVLPVTVIVNGQELTVSSENEFKLIERILDESEADEDEVDLLYPVRIILPDHTQQVIANEDEFENFTDQCTEDGSDDDIECIDFVYPIKLTLYNTKTQVSQVITVNSDNQLYDFLESLEDDDLASFKFPVTVELSDGSVLTVNNVDELETIIENVEDDCDEDDDNDFDDDDTDTSTLEAILTDGSWKISYFFDETNQTALYSTFTFTFNANGTVVATNSTDNFPGTWTLYGDGGELELELVFENDNDLLDEIAEDWTVTSLNTTLVDLHDGNDTILKFQKL